MSFSKSKKIVLILTGMLILGTLSFVVFEQSKKIRIKLASRRYYKQYVKIKDINLIKDDNAKEALLVIVAENSGNRIIDSLALEINYYTRDGKFLGRDNEDMLKFNNEIMLPNKRKVFEIKVICPKQTTDAKVKVKN